MQERVKNISQHKVYRNSETLEILGEKKTEVSAH